MNIKYIAGAFFWGDPELKIWIAVMNDSEDRRVFTGFRKEDALYKISTIGVYPDCKAYAEFVPDVTTILTGKEKQQYEARVAKYRRD